MTAIYAPGGFPLFALDGDDFFDAGIRALNQSNGILYASGRATHYALENYYWPCDASRHSVMYIDSFDYSEMAIAAEEEPTSPDDDASEESE
jgi:hypothetical protein